MSKSDGNTRIAALHPPCLPWCKKPDNMKLEQMIASSPKVHEYQYLYLFLWSMLHASHGPSGRCDGSALVADG